MAKTAIISDIHGNLEALEAVLAHIDQQGIKEVFCLGDIVGYGPNPIECTDLIRSSCQLTIRGNHDEALIHGAVGFNQLARQAIEWTRKVMKRKFWRPASIERWNFLENLPVKMEWEGFLLVHGSPRDPTSEYILDRDIWNLKMFAEIFSKFERVCFVGHTHIAGIFYEGPRFVPQREVEGPFQYEGVKMAINVGSVGQPRDRDPRACYLTVEDPQGIFLFHRVPYDFNKTAAKIRRTNFLNPQLGDRLAEGV